METRTTRYRGERRTFESSSSNFELPSRSYDSKKRQRRTEEPSVLTLLPVILFTLAVFCFIRYVDFRLPTPLSVADIGENPKR